MKIIHLSDLHIGKKVHGFSMLPDQEHILNQICDIIKAQNPDAVIIAGDIYDQSVPSAEAVSLFDRFLAEISGIASHVFIISGNHDSAERIAYGHEIMKRGGVHLSPVFDGNVLPVEIEDEYGKICFYMLPFVRLSEARLALSQAFHEDNTEIQMPEIHSYDDAVKAAISRMNINRDCRNVLITHQFVTGAAQCESEDIISVGGADNVNSDAFSAFDYVALGHLHGSQHIGRESVRYCGTPLKYSFSEKDHKKTITVLDIGNNKNGAYADIAITEIPLNPIRDMREIRGRYNEIMNRENYVNTNTEDYLHIVLTDEEDVPEGISRLRSVYPNIMLLDYDNERTRHSPELREIAKIHRKSRMELLEDLYKMMNGKDMSNEQREFAQSIFDEICNVNQEEK